MTVKGIERYSFGVNDWRGIYGTMSECSVYTSEESFKADRKKEHPKPEFSLKELEDARDFIDNYPKD